MFAVHSVRKTVLRSKFTEQMFTPQEEQNFQMCAQTAFLFRFCKWRKKSCNVFQCLTLGAQFFMPSKSMLAEICVCPRKQLADRLNIIIIYGQKFRRTKVPSSEKRRNRPLFRPWVHASLLTQTWPTGCYPPCPPPLLFLSIFGGQRNNASLNSAH